MLANCVHSEAETGQEEANSSLRWQMARLRVYRTLQQNLIATGIKNALSGCHDDRRHSARSFEIEQLEVIIEGIERMQQLSLMSTPRKKRILASGVVHYPDWIPIQQQQDLLVLVRDWTKVKGSWFTPSMPNGTPMKHPIACLGYRWKPYEYFDALVDMPGELILLAIQALIDTGLKERLPFQPDTCIVNFFPPGSSLGMHQDKSEHQELIIAGSPIVTVSLGDTGVFRLGTVDGPSPYQDIELRSGDLIVMSGASRLAHHGITKILPDTCPPALEMKPGRLSLTMRRAKTC